ncbi:hypothetical protein [Micromonospora okii]|uniref:hypothetical protein n=1 Tax=Micromonospora okii TaxID=1182970 RepID=UPI001E2FB9BB|nr:hypothetical protein [Micromonospora okii]
MSTTTAATVPAPTVGPAGPATPPTGYVGRHRAGRSERRGTHHQVAEPVPGDWSPLDPATRQRIAPGHYTETALPAGPDDRTGVMPAIADPVSPTREEQP